MLAPYRKKKLFMMPVTQIPSQHCVMKCKSTDSLVATFLGTDNLRHPYNSIVYCGSSFPYSIQTVNDISTRFYISIYTGGYPRIKATQYKRQV